MKTHHDVKMNEGNLTIEVKPEKKGKDHTFDVGESVQVKPPFQKPTFLVGNPHVFFAFKLHVLSRGRLQCQ